MKKALSILGQFLLFFLLFAVGSFVHPLNWHWATKAGAGTSRYFIADGLLIALGAFLAIAAIQAIRKRTCDTPRTLIAFLLAVVAGYAIKLGFVTTDIVR